MYNQKEWNLHIYYIMELTFINIKSNIKYICICILLKEII